MHTSDIAAPPLLTQLVTQHQAQWVDFDNIAQWREHQQGDQVLLFAGDPVRFPEALDVAVVLPELRRACASAGRSFGIAVAVPACAEALALTFGSQRWPTLMFFRAGQYVTTVSGMHDWIDYVTRVSQALDAPISRAPTIGIPVVRSTASTDSHCH
jgi:hydrogenase-1 operon protein HyaE